MGAFDFIKNVDWPATFKILGIRLAVASVILTLLFFILGGMPVAEVIPSLFGYFVVIATFIAVSFPAYALSKAGVPYIGLLTYPAWLVCIGDPLVKFIHTKRPDLIPLEEFKFIGNMPMITLEKIEGQPDYFAQTNDPNNGTNQSFSSHNSVPIQNDFERGKQIFNNGEQKDGLEMISVFADNHPHHIEANLFMARELAKADLTGFADLIRKYAQNVVRNAPSNEEAKRILDQLNNMGQPVQTQRSSISLTKNPGEPAQTTQQVNRIGMVAYQAAYQSSSRDQKAWLDSEASALLAKSIISDASMDSGSTITRAALIRVISSYYLRLIQPTDLASQLKIEAEIGNEIAERMASKIVEAVRPV